MRNLHSRPSGGRPTLLAVAFVIVAAACSSTGAATTTSSSIPAPVSSTTTTVSPPPTTVPLTVATTLPPETTTTTTLPVDEGYEWLVGDCFDFGNQNDLSLLPYAPYGNGFQVVCDIPHTHEVFFAGTFGDEAPADFDEALVSETVRTTCADSFRTYFGIPQPDSFFDVVLYLPDADEWAAGERYINCVSYVAGLFGSFDEVQGSFQNAGDAAIWQIATGACLLTDFTALRAATPLPCGGPHTFEIVGDILIPGEAGDQYPGAVELQQDATSRCLEELARYSDDPFVAQPVSVFGLAFGDIEWDLGYRRIVCIGFAADEAGSLLEVRGSFRGSTWEAIGVFGADRLSA